MKMFAAGFGVECYLARLDGRWRGRDLACVGVWPDCLGLALCLLFGDEACRRRSCGGG